MQDIRELKGLVVVAVKQCLKNTQEDRDAFMAEAALMKKFSGDDKRHKNVCHCFPNFFLLLFHSFFFVFSADLDHSTSPLYFFLLPQAVIASCLFFCFFFSLFVLPTLCVGL